jgi:hypothetical protein
MIKNAQMSTVKTMKFNDDKNYMNHHLSNKKKNPKRRSFQNNRSQNSQLATCVRQTRCLLKESNFANDKNRQPSQLLSCPGHGAQECKKGGEVEHHDGYLQNKQASQPPDLEPPSGVFAENNAY